MTTDIDPKKLSLRLIAIYEEYLKNPRNAYNRNLALDLYQDYDFAGDLLDPRLALAISRLFNIALEHPPLEEEKIDETVEGLRALVRHHGTVINPAELKEELITIYKESLINRKDAIIAAHELRGRHSYGAFVMEPRLSSAIVDLDKIAILDDAHVLKHIRALKQ